MAHRAVLAFLDPNLKPLERIYSAWYARYFAEGWRMDCAAEKDIKSNFLTANQYACILLNAESLLLLLVWMLSEEEFRNLPFAPHALGSQQAEEFFRRLRAMFNDPNFTVEGCLWRTNYVQMDSIIRSRRADDFVFPQHRKHTHMDCVRRPGQKLPHISENEISAMLIAARDDAVRDLLALGVKLDIKADSANSSASSLTAAATAEAVQSPVDKDDEQLDDVQAEECDLVPPDVSDVAEKDDAAWDHAIGPDSTTAATPVPGQTAILPPLSAAVLSSARFLDCFSTRPARIKPTPGVSWFVTDDLGFQVDKRRACAIVSMHPKISADRLKRVQKMKQAQQAQTNTVNTA